jgi:hypothetical protein
MAGVPSSDSIHEKEINGKKDNEQQTIVLPRGG